MIITVVATTGANLNTTLNPDSVYHNYVVMGLSILYSFVAGVFAFLNPVVRWKQLRGNALAIESEVWKFRTRTGAYKPKIGEYQVAEKEFQNNIQLIKDNIISKSGVDNADFLKKYDLSVFKHSQYPQKGDTPKTKTMEMAQLKKDKGIKQPLLDDDIVKIEDNPEEVDEEENMINPKHKLIHTVYFAEGASPKDN